MDLNRSSRDLGILLNGQQNERPDQGHSPLTNIDGKLHSTTIIVTEVKTPESFLDKEKDLFRKR